MHANALLLLFLQIAVIIAASRLVGRLASRIGQPLVVGEMLAGIMLGPSLLGWLAPGVYDSLFPRESWQYLGMLAQVGVVFFLFLIGLELDPSLLRDRGHAAVVISHVSIIAPFLLGAVLTLYLYPRVFNDTPEMTFRAVALFMGAAMSITAFPVLARILTERNLHKTNVGAVSITCAAVDDVTAWCMLAFVVAAAKFEGIWQASITAGLSVGYVLLMFFVVRPFLKKLEHVYERRGSLSQNLMALILMLVVLSAATTEWIGIHALFGAFLMGCMMPKGTRFVRDLSEKLEDFTIVLLLPIFFAFSGLKTRIGLLSNSDLLFDTVLIIAVACVGKFGGSTLAARAAGIGWRESAAIGTLMNTRGLMELVILNIGRDLGVITDAVFAMMVLMALVTTAMTQPILNWVYPPRFYRAAPARATGAVTQFSVLIPVSHPKSGGPLVNVADALIGPDRSRGQVFALHLRQPEERDAYRAEEDLVPKVDPESGEALTPLMAQAQARSLRAEAISFVSSDVAGGIAQVAAERNADLVLMGFHNPVFGKSLLGGEVHRVLAQCPAHVAVFIDRGLRVAAKVLVPYLGGPHDRLALELAGRIARNTGARVTILHIVPPMRGEAQRTLEARKEVDRVFDDRAAASAVTMKVIEDTSPVGVVVHQAQQFDLVVIGVSEEWGLESHLFGWRPEKIARDCPCSLLIVRRYEGQAIQGAEVNNPTLPAAPVLPQSPPVGNHP